MRLKVSLEELLEAIYVQDRRTLDEETVKWWPSLLNFAVGSEDTGVIALFRTEKMALQYRLALINQMLNSGWDGGR